MLNHGLVSLFMDVEYVRTWSVFDVVTDRANKMAIEKCHNVGPASDYVS
jgi:hypothetical protein